MPTGQFSGMVAVGFVTREGSDGTIAGFQQVLTPASGGACGFSFTLGKTYQVDAQHDPNGYLVTTSCSATQLTTRTIPVAMYPSDPDMQHQQLHLEWSYPYLMAVGIIAILISAAVTVIRIRRRFGQRRRRTWTI